MNENEMLITTMKHQKENRNLQLTMIQINVFQISF